jgi:hypothetical protein
MEETSGISAEMTTAVVTNILVLEGLVKILDGASLCGEEMFLAENACREPRAVGLENDVLLELFGCIRKSR